MFMCGLLSAHGSPPMAKKYVSRIVVNKLPQGPVTCGGDNLQGIILLVRCLLDLLPPLLSADITGIVEGLNNGLSYCFSFTFTTRLQ